MRRGKGWINGFKFLSGFSVRGAVK